LENSQQKIGKEDNKMQRKKNELTDFGFWVKMRLLEQRRTQADLARQLGTTKQVISRIL